MKLTIDEVGEFISQPTPRSIPKKIRKVKSTASRGLMAFGAIFFLFSAPFMYLFFPWHLEELYIDLGKSEQTSGVVSKCTKTSMSTGGGKHSSGSPVYETSYTFADSKGVKRQGVSYSTRQFKSKQKVKVEYYSGDPSVSRIVGCSLNMAGYAAAFVILFPLVGGGMFLGGYVIRSRRNRILRDGVFAMGKIADVKRTNVSVNEQQRYFVIVEFEDGTGTHSAKYSVYGERAAGDAQEKMDAEEPAGVLYMPDNPSRVLITNMWVE